MGPGGVRNVEDVRQGRPQHGAQRQTEPPASAPFRIGRLRGEPDQQERQQHEIVAFVVGPSQVGQGEQREQSLRPGPPMADAPGQRCPPDAQDDRQAPARVLPPQRIEDFLHGEGPLQDVAAQIHPLGQHRPRPLAQPDGRQHRQQQPREKRGPDRPPVAPHQRHDEKQQRHGRLDQRGQEQEPRRHRRAFAAPNRQPGAQHRDDAGLAVLDPILQRRPEHAQSDRRAPSGAARPTRFGTEPLRQLDQQQRQEHQVRGRIDRQQSPFRQKPDRRQQHGHRGRRIGRFGRRLAGQHPGRFRGPVRAGDGIDAVLFQPHAVGPRGRPERVAQQPLREFVGIDARPHVLAHDPLPGSIRPAVHRPAPLRAIGRPGQPRRQSDRQEAVPADFRRFRHVVIHRLSTLAPH